jgi:MFS family permease
MNKILRLLTISDLFILGSFGLIQPILAIFFTQQIRGATVSGIGLAVTIQLFTKAVFQILIARWADCERGNCRELYTLVVGSIIVSLVPMFYAFAHTMWFIYIIQLFYGLGNALVYPSWRVMFTRYTSQDKAGYEWSVYDTVISLGTAAAAAVGGLLVEQFSFRALFFIVTGLSIIGTAFIILIFKQEFTCKINFKGLKSLQKRKI